MKDDTSNTTRLTEVPLFQSDGATHSTIVARIQPNGSLQISGYDVGEAARAFVGHADYEYDVTVKPEDKDALLLRLLADRFQGDPCASIHFRDYLDAKGIPYDFETWR